MGHESLETLYKIRKNLEVMKKIYDYPNIDIKIFEVIKEMSQKRLLKGKSLERGFSAIGLVIADEKTDFKNSMDEWYGYLIIKSKHYRELTWMMNKMLRLFKDYFKGMEAREYLYDHIGGCMQKSLKKNKINIVFKDVLDEADRLVKDSIDFNRKNIN